MNEDFYINLIYKRLAEEISPSEKQQLEDWLSQSEENRLTAQSVETAWTASDSLQLDLDIDLDAEFAALEQKMPKEELPKKEAIVKEMPKKPSPRRNWLRIAASLLLVLTAGFLLQQYLGNSTNQSVEWLSVQTENEDKEIKLPDNSMVHLNKNSELSYTKNMDGKKRLVKLKGEAFFEVEHNPNKPFIVETTNETVTVLGTSFNVKIIDQAVTEVAVVTGRVEVNQIQTNQKLILEKGQIATSNIQKKFVKRKLSDNSPNALAWHTGKLIFSDVSVEQVFTDLSKLYDAKFAFENPALKKCLFTSTFDKQELTSVLETISTVLGFEFEERAPKNYLLKGGNCD